MSEPRGCSATHEYILFYADECPLCRLHKALFYHLGVLKGFSSDYGAFAGEIARIYSAPQPPKATKTGPNLLHMPKKG